MNMLGEDELTQVMGIGQYGEVRRGPDGQLYQWMQGVDGLGNPIGFWRALRRIGRGLRRFARRALPIVQTAASFIPGAGPAVAAGVRAATPFAQRAGLLGGGGLGALYQSPDGTLYQVQGLAEDEDLRGLAEDEELQGLAEDEELRGLAEDEDIRGLAEDDELRGFAEDDELRGLAEEEDLRGIGQGYVRESVSGLGAYTPEQIAGSHLGQAPAMWKPLW
jgi:hypothetical protein